MRPNIWVLIFVRGDSINIELTLDIWSLDRWGKEKSELGKTFRKPDVPDLASVAGASLFRAKENLEAHRNYTPYSLTKKQYLPIIYYTLVCVCSPSPS